MIKNDRQYRITKAQVAKFEEAIRSLRNNGRPKEDVHPVLRKAEEEALQSQLEDLREEILEYEALRAGVFELEDLEVLKDLPAALIKARIASGMSQKNLADKLGLKEQQIQRYEATDYATASLSRIREVLNVLMPSLSATEAALTQGRTSKEVFARLKEVGLSRRFVVQRVLPNWLVEKLGSKKESEEDLADYIASWVGEVFGWGRETLLRGDALSVSQVPALAVQYKMPAGRDFTRASAYTLYAYRLAEICLKATPQVRSSPAPTNPKQVRSDVIRSLGDLQLSSVVQYAWNLGIVVFPLADPGEFHGACWRMDGRNVIALKQKTRSQSRFVFDLLHEMRHAADDPESPVLEVIETSKAPSTEELPKEQEANKFAGDVLLDGRSEELAQMCVQASQGRLEWLKGAVPKVAEKEGVQVDALANYLAYRLSLQGENWWGAANNLQTEDNPWETVRDELLRRVELDVLESHERELLLKAMTTS
jgi:ribosome-binding protein aMBF1 (putative translation factor)/Zn-dependent peptidase ImmA (M78 family)